MADFQELTAETYEAALGAARRTRGLRATAAGYDRGRGRIVVRLEIGFSPRDAQGLEHAAATDLARAEVSGAGTGLHFPTLDVDFSVPGLLEGRLGSDAWMAGRRAARIA